MTPDPDWPGPDPWLPVLRGALALLREDHERQTAHREQRPDPGPELELLGRAVSDLVVATICSADPARRARLRPLLLDLLRQAQAIDSEVAA